MEEKGENAVKKSFSFELLLCEVPIIPFMLRQEIADIVRKGLIKHCCHNQRCFNWDQTKNHSLVPFQTASHINLDDNVLCMRDCIHVLFRLTRAVQPCQNSGELSSMVR